MQLYALKKNQELILASEAERQTDYLCPECKGVVRLRRGDVRSAHFYHHTPTKECRQSGKSLRHLGVQLYLLELFPKGECTLEKQFPEINRIADVVWEPKKLIFEVQCSPITAKEVKERNRDYEKAGYQVVWLLHDSRFGRWRVTAAESFLQNEPFYYTNIDRHGRGMIYDRFQRFQNGIRSFALPPLQVELQKPILGSDLTFFEGDFRHLVSKHTKTSAEVHYLARSIQILQKSKKKRTNGRFLWMDVLFLQPYRAILAYLLQTI